jgi:hypothetical protein
VHDPLIRGLATNGKVKNAATRGPGFSWPGSAPQAGAFSGFQYLTVPLGRSRHGLRDLLDLETARAMASYLQDVNDSLDSGGGISGPAARRLADAARHAASRFEGLFLSPRQARALLADPALQVHDNPGAFLACNYDPAKALCHPDREAGSTAGEHRAHRRAHHRADRWNRPAARRVSQLAPARPDPPAPRRPRRHAGDNRRTARPHPHHPGRR